MKKINSNLIIVGLFTGLLLQSCKKQLDIPSRNSIDASLALSTKAGIEGSLNSVYSILKRESFYGRDLFSITDAMADITFANGRSSRLLGENRNQSLSNITTALWSGAYGGINEINITLAAIPGIADATPSDKTRWEGEFKFMRALFMFELVKNYAYIPTFTVPAQDKGGVVINLQGFSNPAIAAAFRPSRATTAACYAQIMSDLYAAINLLANNGRGSSTGRNYASKHAALALSSRVRLYEGNWVKADSFATAAITLSGGLGAMSTTTNYVSGWRTADHPEGIFQVWYQNILENIGQNTSLAATHTTLRAPGALFETRQGQGDLMPNAFLLSQLGISGFPAGLAAPSPPPTLTYSNDIRNRLFEWGANASGHYVECTKWLGKNGGANWDNTVVLRWAELFLNRAEARYQMAQEALAWADLNVIRSSRYVGFVVPGVQDFTGPALLNEILRQRMLEFAFEGHRFYDLKRYGLTITKTNPAVTLPASDFRLLPRIPLNEVDGNVNMVQNFGY
ncbi:MAG: RagB/SusD family nutrient uptake outer membrane protein [Bacteroidota bacterium]|nr:RagB/SusD family nutrient uptake outer membrane protein [Bacteroidota bacterium]